MDLSSAKDLFKVASSLAGVIPVVGTQLGGAFAAAESICGMLEVRHELLLLYSLLY
jgi:hypothetical protein